MSLHGEPETMEEREGTDIYAGLGDFGEALTKDEVTIIKGR